MLGLKRVHHIAIIATDYAKSKAFYCDILGFTLQGDFATPDAPSNATHWNPAWAWTAGATPAASTPAMPACLMIERRSMRFSPI